jgi:hypothetical protein
VVLGSLGRLTLMYLITNQVFDITPLPSTNCIETTAWPSFQSVVLRQKGASALEKGPSS